MINSFFIVGFTAISSQLDFLHSSTPKNEKEIAKCCSNESYQLKTSLC